MGDLAYFPFYPERWLADPKVRQLTLEERGAYHELMAGMWTYESGTCALPNDDGFLARFLGVSVRKWKSLRRALIDGSSSPIHTSEDGMWVFSPLLQEQHAKATQKSASSAASASRRWSGGNAKAMRTHSERNANAERSQSDGNATQEPEPDIDKNPPVVPPMSDEERALIAALQELPKWSTQKDDLEFVRALARAAPHVDLLYQARKLRTFLLAKPAKNRDPRQRFRVWVVAEEDKARATPPRASPAPAKASGDLVYPVFPPD